MNMSALKFWNRKNKRSFEDMGFVSDAVFPHCDPRVLHAPHECGVCDHYPHYQALRQMWGINFTGQDFVYSEELSDSSWRMLPCPSDFNRGLNGAHVWGGNRPLTKPL